MVAGGDAQGKRRGVLRTDCLAGDVGAAVDLVEEAEWVDVCFVVAGRAD